MPPSYLRVTIRQYPQVIYLQVIIQCNATMDKFEQRRLALEALVGSLGRGGIAQVANKIGKEPNYVSRMLYQEGKPGRKRIGEDSVEVLNTAYPGWLSRRSTEGHTSQDPKDREKPANLIGLKNGASFTLLPVVQFQGLNMKQQNDVAKLENVDWLTTPGQFSIFAKVTTMPDNSMYPDIYPGEYIAFDPDVDADAGDTVLIGDQHGGLWIRKFRPLPGGRFDAIAVNDDHAPLRSTEDNVKVLAVLVGHWRGRRSRKH